MALTAEKMRQCAEMCKEMFEQTDKPPAKVRLQRLAEAWERLAETQDWLDSQNRRHG